MSFTSSVSGYATTPKIAVELGEAMEEKVVAAALQQLPFLDPSVLLSFQFLCFTRFLLGLSIWVENSQQAIVDS